MGWECNGGYCFEVSGTGDYPTLADCVADGCASPTYDCINGVCTFAALRGFYLTLDLCESACFLPPPPPTGTGDGAGVSYNCIPGTGTAAGGTCEDPGDGSGLYSTLQECEEFCLRDIPIPLGCSEVEDDYTQTRRRTGCSGMIYDYNLEDVQIFKKTTQCEDGPCDAWMELYADSTVYQIGRVTTNPPCLCITNLPEDCDPSSIVLHAVVSAAGCPEIHGLELDLTYDGTDCNHQWSVLHETASGCFLEITITCSCCEVGGAFSFGPNAICGVGEEFTVDYDCNPLVVTMTQTECTYSAFDMTSCGTCAIQVTVTL